MHVPALADGAMEHREHGVRAEQAAARGQRQLLAIVRPGPIARELHAQRLVASLGPGPPAGATESGACAPSGQSPPTPEAPLPSETSCGDERPPASTTTLTG